MLTGEEAEGVQPDQRLHPAKPGPDRGLAEDLDQPELAGALGVGTATQLSGVVAHLDDANLVAVPLAEQRHRPDPPRLGLVGDEGADFQVVDQYGVHLVLDVAEQLGVDGGRRGEVEAQPAGRVLRTGLGRRLPHQAADGAMDEVCLLYTSDAADEEDSVDLGGRRIIKKKKKKIKRNQ